MAKRRVRFHNLHENYNFAYLEMIEFFYSIIMDYVFQELIFEILPTKVSSNILKATFDIKLTRNFKVVYLSHTSSLS